ncbi:hypothetical protein [Crassaminicella profunda]|uniref:hypothetical protein n=1 Tax=Crassaminicella profunda TaxID=1286698 RepID=UPI001CA78C95|nr:hypothetical protein [Crassaminicella profunda]QZY56077.1 hypothetical protein K7H06_03490 [Crassaminicella profunda]
MKKLYILLSLVYILNFTTYAEESILGGKGDTIYPILDTSVQMMSEKVEIKVDKGIAHVESEFVLKNTGKKEKNRVGIPACGIGDKIQEVNSQLHDFKVEIDGKKVSNPLKKGVEKEGYGPNWYMWEMSFDEEEMKRIKNTYWMHLSSDGIGGEVIEYVLKNGGGWNKAIKYGKITMEFESDFDPENFEILDYEKYKKNKKVEVKVMPEEKKVIWEFYNLEPDFNIALYSKDVIRNEKKDLLEVSLSPSDKELWQIQNLGKKAYENYTKGNYDDSWANMDQIEKYKESQEDQISKYAIRMIHWLDYYRAMILLEKGEYEKSAYYFKTNGVFEEKNLYQLSMLYKKSGNIDDYIQMLKCIVKGKRDRQVIKVWAEQELKQLPVEIKEKYGIIHQNNKEEKSDEKIEREEKESKKEKFSYRAFILFNTGIVILLGVVYWNIKKK